MSEAEFGEQIISLVVSRCFVSIIQTYEEQRAVDILKRLCETKLKRPLVSWDVAEGFRPIYPDDYKFTGKLDTTDPLEALKIIDEYGAKGDKADANLKILFLLKDFHEFFEVGNAAQIKRMLRNMSHSMTPNGKQIFLICPNKKMPDEFRDSVEMVELPMPREEEINSALKILEEKVKGFKVTLDSGERQKMIQAALGLTGVQATRAFRKAAAREEDGTLRAKHIPAITEHKRQVIKQSEALEYFPVSETFADIGGLEVLKDWLLLRKGSFSEEAKKYNLPAPKGVLLIGVPGTGKSLTAKAIGSIWQMSVLRLDTGALFGGLVGESEERTRRALEVANTVSPCILWIDELEKAFGSQDIDGGTSQRVFGSILTWMQEKTSPVFVVATANDVGKLPPELLRKGRFDEIFFLDLPTEEERREIYSVLLKKYGWAAKDFDLKRLAKESEYFVGAEIEQAIVGAMHRAFNDKARPIKEDDIRSALQSIKPLAISHKELVGHLRKWVTEGKIVSASFRSKTEAVQKVPDLRGLEDELEVITREGS